MEFGARFLELCYALSILAHVAQHSFLGSRPQGQSIFLICDYFAGFTF